MAVQRRGSFASARLPADTGVFAVKPQDAFGSTIAWGTMVQLAPDLGVLFPSSSAGCALKLTIPESTESTVLDIPSANDWFGLGIKRVRLPDMAPLGSGVYLIEVSTPGGTMISHPFAVASLPAASFSVQQAGPLSWGDVVTLTPSLTSTFPGQNDNCLLSVTAPDGPSG